MAARIGWGCGRPMRLGVPRLAGRGMAGSGRRRAARRRDAGGGVVPAKDAAGSPWKGRCSPEPVDWETAT